MVEFLIVAPLFMFLITGTIQMMGISHAHSLLQYGNFLAVRTGIVHYERMAHGFADGGRAPEDDELVEDMTDLMRDSVIHGLGPLYRDPLPRIPGIELPDFLDPPWISPVVVEQPGLLASLVRPNVRLQWGVVNVPEDSPRMPQWLFARSEIDLGLGMPFAGQVIEAVQMNIAAPDEQGAVAAGFDALSPADPEWQSGLVNSILHPDIYDYPYIQLSSDASLDLRERSYRQAFFGYELLEENWVPWPLTEISAETVTVYHDNTGALGLLGGLFASPEAPGPNDPQPAALPVQLRFWEEEFLR